MQSARINCPIIVLSCIYKSKFRDLIREKSLTGGTFANMSLPDHPGLPDETIYLLDIH
jgi:hypothetical protein